MLKPLLLSLFLIPNLSWSQDFTQPKCDMTYGAYITDQATFFEENSIELVSPQISLGLQNQFIAEYLKFPERFRQMLVEGDSVIRLILGEGVADDPTWSYEGKAKDGRNFADVPGTGGFPSIGKRGAYPTRLVINKLYGEGHHGSVNMVLHEVAHSLDNLKWSFYISSSKQWKKLTETDIAKRYLEAVCPNYCNLDSQEAFAELMAHYYSCASSREYLLKWLPEIGRFFFDLETTNLYSKLRR